MEQITVINFRKMRSIKNIKSILFIFILFGVMSCSDKDEPKEIPGYVGSWQRTWSDDTKGLNFQETITIDENGFEGEINIVEGSNLLPYIQYNGIHTVIDNTLEAWIKNIGVAGDNNSLTFICDTDNNFETSVVENLNIHPNFIGTYFLESNTLTLRLDLDGDFSVSGNEGLFIYEMSN